MNDTSIHDIKADLAELEARLTTVKVLRQISDAAPARSRSELPPGRPSRSAEWSGLRTITLLVAVGLGMLVAAAVVPSNIWSTTTAFMTAIVVIESSRVAWSLLRISKAEAATVRRLLNAPTEDGRSRSLLQRCESWWAIGAVTWHVTAIQRESDALARSLTIDSSSEDASDQRHHQVRSQG